MAMLEIACFSPEGGAIAEQAGADRIELCADHSVGGTTPPEAWLIDLKARVRVPIFVMVRPRGGNFEYSDEEFEVMKRSIDRFKTRADGFVFGVLQNDRVNVDRTAELVQRSKPLPCTFHRAFDETRDLEDALEDIIDAGCSAILSSGGAATAIDGFEALSTLVKCAGQRIAIIPGGGVRSHDLGRLREETQATIFHSSALRNGALLPDTVEVQKMVGILHEKAVGAVNA